MIGIYSIEHVASGRRYIGKSKHIDTRRYAHKYHLTRETPDPKYVNRRLYLAVKKYGWSAFKFSVLESFDEISDEALAARELFWMDHFDACGAGYNLRRDSSSGMTPHASTRALIASNFTGASNPNFGNAWTSAQRAEMREIAKNRHASGEHYDASWRAKLGAASSATWKDAELKAKMARNVSLAKMKYDFYQYDKSSALLRVWASVAEIVEQNPEYKWQNIYSVCNGHKPTYRGFIWKKILKNDN